MPCSFVGLGLAEKGGAKVGHGTARNLLGGAA